MLRRWFRYVDQNTPIKFENNDSIRKLASDIAGTTMDTLTVLMRTRTGNANVLAAINYKEIE